MKKKKKGNSHSDTNRVNNLRVIPGTVYGVVTDLSKILIVRNDSIEEVPVHVTNILYSSVVLKSSSASAFRNTPAAKKTI